MKDKDNREKLKVFRSNLTRCRIGRDLSAREMSYLMGRSPGYINSVENGYTIPKLDSVLDMCEVLQVDPVEFFAGTGKGGDSERETGGEILLP